MDKTAVLKALHELGFRYKEDEYGSYGFSYETYNYVCSFEKDDETFVNILVPNIYTVEDDQYRPIILEIMNELNCSMKVSKIMLVSNSVWVSYEFHLTEGMDVESALSYAITNLLVTTERFGAKVNGGGFPQIGS